jgi:hypothetical protein
VRRCQGVGTIRPAGVHHSSLAPALPQSGKHHIGLTCIITVVTEIDVLIIIVLARLFNYTGHLKMINSLGFVLRCA